MQETKVLEGLGKELGWPGAPIVAPPAEKGVGTPLPPTARSGLLGTAELLCRLRHGARKPPRSWVLGHKQGQDGLDHPIAPLEEERAVQGRRTLWGLWHQQPWRSLRRGRGGGASAG